MQSLLTLKLDCQTHKGKKLGYVCLKPECKKRFICFECSKEHEVRHKESFITIPELFDLKVEEVYKEAADKSEEILNASLKAINEIDVHFDNLKNDLIEAVEDLRAEYKAKLFKPDFEKLLVALYETKEKLKEKLDLKLSDFVENKEEFSDLYVKFLEKKEEFKSVQGCPEFTYDWKKFEEVKKAVDKFITKKKLVPSSSLNFIPFNFDRARICSYLRYDFNTITVNRQGYAGKLICCGNLKLNKGTFSWYCKVNQLDIDQLGLGLCFGIFKDVDAQRITQWNNEYVNSDAVYYSSEGKVMNMNKVSDPSHKNIIYLCHLDLKQLKFIVKEDENILAEADVEDDCYVPFFLTSAQGSIQILFEK